MYDPMSSFTEGNSGSCNEPGTGYVSLGSPFCSEPVEMESVDVHVDEDEMQALANFYDAEMHKLCLSLMDSIIRDLLKEN